jgi:hypothetical protein
MYTFFAVVYYPSCLALLLLIWFILKRFIPRAVLRAICLVLTGFMILPELTAWINWRTVICPTGGIHVYRTEKVEGYYDDVASVASAEAALQKGYRFVEINNKDSKARLHDS